MTKQNSFSIEAAVSKLLQNPLQSVGKYETVLTPLKERGELQRALIPPTVCTCTHTDSAQPPWSHV